MSVQHLHKLQQECMQKRWKWKSTFCLDLMLLETCVRSAVLLDYGTSDAKMITRAIEELKEKVPGSLKAVRVLVIDANIFMISLDSFIQDLRAALDSNFENFEFIDVDPQLEKPASVDAKTHSTIASVLSSLVKTILETVDSKASEVCITLNLNCGSLIITLAGVILKYCAVYFYGSAIRAESTESPSGSSGKLNCLGGTPLMFVRFSLKHDFGMCSTRDADKYFAPTKIKMDRNVILSFSVPLLEGGQWDKLHTKHPAIIRTLEELRSRVDQSGAFYDLMVSMDIMQLDSVVL